MYNFVLSPIDPDKLAEMVAEKVFQKIKNDIEIMSYDKKETDFYLNINQASEFLKVKKETIYHYMSKKMIPFYKTNGRAMFLKNELIDWVKTRGNT
jgi:excisionase family DNA binding protein